MDNTLTPDEVYAKLVAIVKGGPLGWVIEQVEDTVRFGVPEAKSISVPSQPQATLPSATIEGSKKHKSSRTIFEAVRPFTSQERLLLLVKALRRATVEVAGIEESIIDTLGAMKAKSTVEFYRDSESAAPTRIESSALASRKSAVARLDAALLAVIDDAGAA